MIPCDAASTTIGYGSISPGSPGRNPRPRDNQELPPWLRRGAAAGSRWLVRQGDPSTVRMHAANVTSRRS